LVPPGLPAIPLWSVCLCTDCRGSLQRCRNRVRSGYCPGLTLIGHPHPGRPPRHLVAGSKLGDHSSPTGVSRVIWARSWQATSVSPPSVPMVCWTRSYCSDWYASLHSPSAVLACASASARRVAELADGRGVDAEVELGAASGDDDAVRDDLSERCVRLQLALVVGGRRRLREDHVSRCRAAHPLGRRLHCPGLSPVGCVCRGCPTRAPSTAVDRDSHGYARLVVEACEVIWRCWEAGATGG
jgi:hypothetical protein